MTLFPISDDTTLGRKDKKVQSSARGANITRAAMSRVGFVHRVSSPVAELGGIAQVCCFFSKKGDFSF